MPLGRATDSRDNGIAVVFSLNASTFGMAEQARFRSRIATAGAIPVDRVIIRSIRSLNRLVDVDIRPSWGDANQAPSEAAVRRVETSLAWNEDALEFDVTIVSIARIPLELASPPIVDVQTSGKAADDGPEVFSPTYRAVLVAAALALVAAGSAYTVYALRRGAPAAEATEFRKLDIEKAPSPVHSSPVAAGSPVKIQVATEETSRAPSTPAARLMGESTPSPGEPKSEAKTNMLSPVSPLSFAGSDDCDYVVSV